MRRREFISLAGSTAISWSLSAQAQEPRQVIGVLSSGSHGAYPGVEDAFLQGLKAAGFVEGQNISIDWRRAQSQYDRLPSLASELVSRGVSVIACLDAPAAFAAKAATRTIPIVFATGGDPVKTGLVDSFSRPGGNVTGASNLVSALLTKQLELLREVIPTEQQISLLVNSNNPNFQTYEPEAEFASKAIGRPVQMLTARSEADIDAAFTKIQRQAVALVLVADPFFIIRREQIVALAARYAVPTVYPFRWFPDIGGLMSYGTPTATHFRQVGIYTGKILKGAKPADLPIQQSTGTELVINLKTAKALGLTIPPSLLARADEVIE
jgi:putative ABC transport system substrate-binding protein